jgi:hypothetical protein
VRNENPAACKNSLELERVDRIVPEYPAINVTFFRINPVVDLGGEFRFIVRFCG